jgi:hypothetical protein
MFQAVKTRKFTNICQINAVLEGKNSKNTNKNIIQKVDYESGGLMFDSLWLRHFFALFFPALNRTA